MTACTLHKSQKQAEVCLSHFKVHTGTKIGAIWQRKEILRICSGKSLVEKAQDIEVTTPVKNSQEKRHNLNPAAESFFIDYFWDRRPDGVAM